MSSERYKNELLLDLKELETVEESRFYQIPFKRVLQLNDKSVLVEFDRYAFKDPNSKRACEPVWFPRDKLRKREEQVHFPAMLSTQKGLNI